MMPYVMEFVQSSMEHGLTYHMPSAPALDMMYTIMRYCDMPSLYICKSTSDIQTQLDSYVRSFDETVETMQNWEIRKAEIKRELDEIDGRDS